MLLLAGAAKPVMLLAVLLSLTVLAEFAVVPVVFPDPLPVAPPEVANAKAVLLQTVQ